MLGEGGMGTVLKYRNPAISKFVAIKLLKTNLFSDDSYTRFIREGRAAARLRHRNLLTVHDLGILEGNQPYMVMDYFEGKTFADLLKEGIPLSETQLLDTFIQCCDAMSYAHANGILHRDLKPSNIMVSDVGSTKPQAIIFDFGVSKLLDDDTFAVTRAGDVFGSPLYMSPEQCDGKTLNVQSDIYSLGCTFYEILTGAPPFSADSLFELMSKHKHEKPLSLKEASLGRTFPQSLEVTVKKMLEKVPADRPESMAAVKEMLLNTAPGDGTLRAVSGSSPSSSKKQLQQSHAKGFGARHVIGVVLGIGLLLYFALSYLSHPTGTILPGHDSALSDKHNRTDHPDAPGQVVNATKTAADNNISIAASGQPDKTDTANGAARATAKRLRGEALAILNVESAGRHNPIVDLNGLAITDQDMEALLANHRMIVLKVDHTDIGDAGLRTICKIKTLQAVHADHTKITNAGIPELTKLPHLKNLHISETSLDDGCTAALAKMTGLEDLTLRDTRVSDKGVANLVRLKNLRMLQLNRTDITDNGVKLIAENLPGLEALHLRGNEGISDKSLQYVEKLKHLRLFTLSGCQNVTANGYQSFFQRHPDIKEAHNSAERFFNQLTDQKSLWER